MPKIVAIDFDGTIAKTRYPIILEPIPESRYMKKWQKAGHKLILWTCREGQHLTEAVEWCQRELGVVFDRVNENLPEVIESFKNDPRKIVCDYFLDDKFPVHIATQWEHLNYLLGGKGYGR